jgi:hypothetical protein
MANGFEPVVRVGGSLDGMAVNIGAMLTWGGPWPPPGSFSQAHMQEAYMLGRRRR